MDSVKYIGMDVLTETISIAVRNFSGKLVMECIIETKASTILQFFQGLSGNLQVTFEEGTWAAWLYDLLKPHVTELVAGVVWPWPTARFVDLSEHHHYYRRQNYRAAYKLETFSVGKAILRCKPRT